MAEQHVRVSIDMLILRMFTIYVLNALHDAPSMYILYDESEPYYWEKVRCSNSTVLGHKHTSSCFSIGTHCRRGISQLHTHQSPTIYWFCQCNSTIWSKYKGAFVFTIDL